MYYLYLSIPALLVTILGFWIFYCIRKFKIKESLRLENTKVYNLLNNKYQVIIFEKQYRVYFSEKGYAYDSVVYNFPNGTAITHDHDRDEYEHVIDSIIKFNKYEEINNMRKKFEAELSGKDPVKYY